MLTDCNSQEGGTQRTGRKSRNAGNKGTCPPIGWPHSIRIRRSGPGRKPIPRPGEPRSGATKEPVPQRKSKPESERKIKGISRAKRGPWGSPSGDRGNQGGGPYRRRKIKMDTSRERGKNRERLGISGEGILTLHTKENDHEQEKDESPPEHATGKGGSKEAPKRPPAASAPGRRWNAPPLTTNRRGAFR